MNWELLLTIFVTIITSGAVFGFIEFLVKRKDNKNDKQQEIIDKIDTLSDKFAERDARIARENILRFDDELIAGVKHSREYFRVILEDDVDGYEAYCREHTEFKNSFTAEAVAHIRRVYSRLVEQGEFKAS